MTTRPHFAPLDGLRGLAAAAVMLRHLNEEFSLPQFVGHGYLAVDLFFILSGFVISWAYEHRLATGWSSTEFVRVRLIRLFPLIVLGSLLGGFVTALERQPLDRVAEATLLSALAMPFPWRNLLFPINSPLWSMCYELVSNGFYVVCRSRLTAKVIWSTIAVAAVALILMTVKIGDLDTGFSTHHGWAGALRLTFPFLAGVLIYRLHISGSALRRGVPAWMLGVGLIAVFVAPKATGLGGAAFDVFCSLLVLPALVWFGLRIQLGHRLTWMCVLAGELSYPVYVIHKPIESAMGRIARHLAAPERAAAACGCVVVIISLAALAARKYDAPIRGLLMALTAPRRKPKRSGALIIQG